MKSNLELVILVGVLCVFFKVDNIKCDIDNDGFVKSLNNNNNNNELDRKSSSSFRSYLNRQHQLVGVGSQLKHKRSLKDVERLMAEDELMSMLICDVCEKHVCVPKYCGYCDQCSNINDNNNYYRNKNEHSSGSDTHGLFKKIKLCSIC
jgi:hypothetical protein